jgi:hypothetical protein
MEQVACLKASRPAEIVFIVATLRYSFQPATPSNTAKSTMPVHML